MTTLFNNQRCPHYPHLGLYGYRASFLKHYAELSPCILIFRTTTRHLSWQKNHLNLAKISAGHGVDTEDYLETIRAFLA
ncbi:MAG: hypothetical protein HRT92_06200 [Piscirickettsiaceae bacterium]|nr:hypothetical protein [Piscirickettsiaceae bacterium]